MVWSPVRNLLLLPLVIRYVIRRLFRLRKRNASLSVSQPIGRYRAPHANGNRRGSHRDVHSVVYSYNSADKEDLMAVRSEAIYFGSGNDFRVDGSENGKSVKLKLTSDSDSGESYDEHSEHDHWKHGKSGQKSRRMRQDSFTTERGMCNPRGKSYRYTFLAVLFCYQFASNLCFDSPAALQDHFERDLRITYSQFMSFYHLYCWPNVILCLIGGYLVDRVLGVAFSAVLFSAMVTLGQSLFAFGAYTNNLLMMDAGRVVFSFGNEPLGVVVTAFALKHFGDAEVNLIVGLQLSVEFASNTMCMNMMKVIYTHVFEWLHCDAYSAHRCLGVSLAFAGVSCLVSVVLAWTLVILDRRIPPNSRNAAMQHGHASTASFSSMEKKKQDNGVSSNPLRSAASRSTAELLSEVQVVTNGGSRTTTVTFADQNGVLEHSHAHAHPVGGKSHSHSAASELEVHLSFSETCSFSAGFWLLGAIGIVYAGTVFQFVSVGVVYFERKYHFDSAEANLCNSLVYVLSAFGCPLFGAVVDRVGYNIYWVAAGSVLACIGHLLFAFTYVSPYVPVLVLGASYSVLCSAFWSSVGLVVADHQYGTAIGMMQSLENLALASFAVAVGAILDNFGYLVMEIFLLFFSYVSVALCIALYCWSRSTPKLGVMHISAAQRRKQRV